MEDFSLQQNLCGLADLDEALSRGEDAQTQGQQDPAPEEAATVPILLQLFADLTVDFIPEYRFKMSI